MKKMTSSQIKRLIIIALIVCNIIFLVVYKNSTAIYAVYDRYFVTKPYVYPSQNEAEKFAGEIAQRLSSGDVQSVGEAFDPNAFGYFFMGVTNWANDDDKRKLIDKFQSELAGLKNCQFMKYNGFSDDGSHIITFHLLYESDIKKRAIAELYKNNRGVIGLKTFAVLPDDSIVTDAFFN